MRKMFCVLSAFVMIFVASGCARSTSPQSSQISSQPTTTSHSSSSSGAQQGAEWWEQEVMPLPLAQSPLTGLPLFEGYEKGQRPVAIVVANDAKALPQRGLAQADVVYEMPIEGGTTRLMAIYSDYKTLPEVGPVRSAQDQFIQVAIPQDFILQHIGSSVYGNNLLAVEQYKTVDGINLGENAFKFDNNRFSAKYGHRSSEYCWYTDAGLLWTGMEQTDIYTSAEEKSLFRFTANPAQSGTDAYYVRVVYSPSSNASFAYDEGTGLYNKNIFDAPHTMEDGTQLCYTNVLLLEAQIGLKAEGQLLEFDFSGGEGYYFTAGKIQKIQWHKGAPDEQLKFADMEGNMLEIQPGKSYVGFVPKNEGAGVLYTSKEEVEKAKADAEAAAAAAVENPTAEEAPPAPEQEAQPAG